MSSRSLCLLAILAALWLASTPDPFAAKKRTARTADGRIIEWEEPDNLREEVRRSGHVDLVFPPVNPLRDLKELVANCLLVAEIQVRQTRSYLSDDGKWIFTEVIAEVGETFLGHWPANEPLKIVLFGGRIHFPEGDAEMMTDGYEFGLPKKGFERYVVFLNQDDRLGAPEAFSLSNGPLSLYRISAGRVIPANTVYSPAKNYLGVDYLEFQQAIIHATEPAR